MKYLINRNNINKVRKYHTIKGASISISSFDDFQDEDVKQFIFDNLINVKNENSISVTCNGNDFFFRRYNSAREAFVIDCYYNSEGHSRSGASFDTYSSDEEQWQIFCDFVLKDIKKLF